jgi:hypothetical protein
MAPQSVQTFQEHSSYLPTTVLAFPDEEQEVHTRAPSLQHIDCNPEVKIKQNLLNYLSANFFSTFMQKGQFWDHTSSSAKPTK